MTQILRFSEAASLAMHAAVLMASGGRAPLPVSKAARQLSVSEAHLVKVLQRLGKAGLVTSSRGCRGGFMLARPAAGIRLLDVYEAIEGKLTVTGCLFRKEVCPGKQCIFGGLLGRLSKQMLRHMRGTRLSQLKGVFRDQQTGG